MSIRTPIASTMAQLRLTAISSLQGRPILKGLQWTIRFQKDNSEQTSSAAQPKFECFAGEYFVSVEVNQRQVDVGTITLKSSECLDHVVLIQEADHYDSDEAYHLDSEEVDAVSELFRRQEERAGQEAFGAAAGPLSDPYQQQATDNGMGFQSHPMLQSAQHDGMPPDMKIDPSENTQAVQQKLELQQQLQLGAQNTSAPTPSPTGG